MNNGKQGTIGEVDVSIEAGNPTHYVDWGAIAAGVFVAVAISSVFLTFGSAIGLSMTSFRSGAAAPVAGVAIAAGLWFLWVQLSSFIGGAYLTGRIYADFIVDGRRLDRRGTPNRPRWRITESSRV